ncbi:lipoprotein LpqH [Mycolicibacterium sp.]|uniref:lipoprotein LpqH n=1 Tax=Mycolicibacterium sp. TaxID=2320850 RepID=UPI0028AA6CB0|nr:lipoprotein LpqH [Mycolicibacterium sp.]
MVRGFVVGVASAAIAAAGLTGCSSDNTSQDSAYNGATSDSSSSSVTASAGSATAAAGAGTAMVSIDGQPKDIAGQIACATVGDKVNIAIGQQTTGIGVMMASDASTVTSVGLGNVDGVALGYQDGAPGGSATATKDGQTYTISGTATGVDMANPMQPMTKPFEIRVTCP